MGREKVPICLKNSTTPVPSIKNDSSLRYHKIGINSGILCQKIGVRNRYVFEASMAGPRPKSGQVYPRAGDTLDDSADQGRDDLWTLDQDETWALVHMCQRRTHLVGSGGCAFGKIFKSRLLESLW